MWFLVSPQFGLWGFALIAWQAPYALLVLDILMGQSIWDNLMGIATGHLYHVIRYVVSVLLCCEHVVALRSLIFSYSSLFFARTFSVWYDTSSLLYLFIAPHLFYAVH